MKRKRMIKLLMAMGCDRNDAVRAADMCDGNNWDEINIGADDFCSSGEPKEDDHA